MTAGSRPNLGGLFNGSVPPEQSSRINGFPGPRLVAAPPVAPSEVDASTAVPPQGGAADGDIAIGGGSTEQNSWSVTDLLDPMKALERYFGLLQSALDLNRDFAYACTRAVLSLPGRVGIHR